MTSNNSIDRGLTLVLGANGKTGRRVVEGLEKRGIPVRKGSRSGNPSFSWTNDSTWDDVLDGVEAIYISYSPDLAMPGATDAIRVLVQKARAASVRKLVLLSGRGEEEAQACERIVMDSGIDTTVVRCSWFNQNFSEGAFIDMILAGNITLPAADVPEPFVDTDDIADVALAALTESGHEGEIYELTGPTALTFDDIAAELTAATGREILFTRVPHDAFVSGIAESGAPEDVVWMLDYLFSTVLDGRNKDTNDGVQRALGRAPKSFAEYARETAATGVWDIENKEAV